MKGSRYLPELRAAAILGLGVATHFLENELMGEIDYVATGFASHPVAS
jgi:hypothetical protein